MKQKVITIYRFIFCRKIFYRFNYHVYKMSLRGLGVFNSEGNHITGESYFLKYLSEHMNIRIIFDIGANDGGYATEVRTYFPKAKIFAFEPHPLTFQALKETSNRNNLTSYNYAVGGTNGKLLLWDFADDAELKYTQPSSTLASVHRDVIEDFHKQKAQSFTVKQITIDSFIKKNDIKEIDFLKIDTEGSEYDVLLGASEAIKKNKIHIIQFEFNEMNAYSKRFFKDFIDLLPGYKFYRLMPKGILPLGKYRPSTHELYGFQNIVAVSGKYSEKVDQM